MKLETRVYSEGKVISISFDKQDTPLIEEMARPYFEKYGNQNKIAQQAGFILLDSMEISAFKEEPLNVNLDPEEFPVFVGEMSKATTEYIDKQLKFWQVLTSRTPRLEEGMASKPSDYHEADELFDPAEGIDLDILERKLVHANQLSENFTDLAKHGLE